MREALLKPSERLDGEPRLLQELQYFRFRRPHLECLARDPN
jgi:hypothetical protein